MWLAFVGCESSPPPGSGRGVESTGVTGRTGETGTPPSADTGAAPCAVGVAPLAHTLCAETDAGPYSYPQQQLVVVGTVTDVGGELPPVAGSEPIGEFYPCEPRDAHQIRVVDGAGHSWTVGWGVAGAVDDASTDAIAPGAAVSLVIRSRQTNRSSVAFALADTGPLVLAEQVMGEPLLTDAERGGIGAEVAPYGEVCLGVDPYDRPAWLQTVTFSAGAGSVTLDSGESATFALGDRSLALVLPVASMPCPGGGDGGPFEVWIGWKTP